MARISVNDLQKGMVLAEDLVTERGQFLLPKGIVLDAEHLQSMQTWGVTEVSVTEGVPGQGLARKLQSFPPEVLKESKDYTRRIFRLCKGKHPGVKEIARHSLVQTAEFLAAGKTLVGSVASSIELLKQEIEATPAKKSPSSPHDLVKSEVLLTSLPDIYYQITQTLKDPKSSAKDMADVIGKDPSLSAKLLQLVNSPFYGFPSRIDSLSRAVALTGTRELSMLAMSISVMRLFKDIPESLFDMRAFWKHSIACGIFAKLLAREKGVAEQERFFLAGLLHDLGRLILLKQLPRGAKQAMLSSRLGGTSLHAAEKETFGFDHAKITGLLLMEWNFPKPLTFMIAHHHSPARGDKSLDPSIIHLADILAISMHMGSSGSFYVPPLDETAWDIAGLSTAALGRVCDQARDQFNDVAASFIKDE